MSSDMGWEDIAKNILGALPLSARDALEDAPPEAKRAFDALTSTLLNAARNLDGGVAPDPQDAKNVSRPRRETVFVVHGREDTAWTAMRDFLGALDLSVQTFRSLEANGWLPPPRNLQDFLKKAFQRAQTVVVLLTPDVRAELAPTLSSEPATLQPAANVLVEAGMALGMHPERTVLVKFPGVQLPAALEAWVAVEVQVDDREMRERLLGQLRATELHIREDAAEHLTHGDFQAVLDRVRGRTA
jgi:predicted nucleotide-binding protein